MTPASVAGRKAGLWAVLLVMLAGCSSDAQKIVEAVKALEAGCAVPLRIEMHAGTWSREGVFTCDEMKPGAFK